MKRHVAAVAASCFYHLRRIRQICRRVGTEGTTQLVLAFITPRMDYCNSVLAGLPQVTLEPLQRVQNAAMRLILDLNMWDHVSLGLRQLHWLPVRWRIQHKLCIPSCTPYTLVDVQPVFDRLPTVHLVLGCGQQNRRNPFHRGSKRNSENGLFRSLVRLPGTLFRPNYAKPTIQLDPNIKKETENTLF